VLDGGPDAQTSSKPHQAGPGASSFFLSKLQKQNHQTGAMLRRRPRPCAFLRLFATSCRRSSLHPTRPYLPNHTVLPPPPVAKKVPFTVSAHGRSWSDPYHWMRDTSDPDLASLLTAENTYADAFVGSAAGLRARLAAEMRARLPPSAATPPQPWGPWFVVSRCLVVMYSMDWNVLTRFSKLWRY
jgi:hypothetical protein